MIAAPLVVFVIGLRHGADPDHLAAIDNLTRNVAERMPHASRFVGTLFAIGHSGMVLVTAGAAALLGARIGHVSASFERAGELASIAVLLLVVALNIATLLRRTGASFRAALVPKMLRDATHPLVAIPTGALFGLGFETSSQLVAYGAAFSSSHVANGLAIGAAFCLGMVCTDTVDSLLVARVVATGTTGGAWARRLWISVVTLVALVVAGKEIAALFGFVMPFDEVAFAAATVALLLATSVVVTVGERWNRFARAAGTVEALESR
ncbi:MAG: nickel permease [Vulcanimicrobiaceae bacterium]